MVKFIDHLNGWCQDRGLPLKQWLILMCQLYASGFKQASGLVEPLITGLEKKKFLFQTNKLSLL